jgi:site-specific DNA recombinase
VSNGQRVLAYVRCSTQEQWETGFSLEAQRSRIEAWCLASGATLAELVEDKGVSGAKPLAGRPGGSRIAELLDERNPHADAVVVVRLDRLGRDAAETLALLKRFARGRVGLVSITERLDLTTAQGRAMAGMAAVFAELERSLLGQRTAEALNTLREQGKVYGPVPFGYAASEGFLQPIDKELRVIAAIKDMRDAGHSFRVIANRLNGKGVPSKRGGPWSPMAVRSVLRTSGRLLSSSIAVQPS